MGKFSKKTDKVKTKKRGDIPVDTKESKKREAHSHTLQTKEFQEKLPRSIKVKGHRRKNSTLEDQETSLRESGETDRLREE